MEGPAAEAVQRLARAAGVSPAELVRRALRREDDAQRGGPVESAGRADQRPIHQEISFRTGTAGQDWRLVIDGDQVSLHPETGAAPFGPVGSVSFDDPARRDPGASSASAASAGEGTGVSADEHAESKADMARRHAFAVGVALAGSHAQRQATKPAGEGAGVSAGEPAEGGGEDAPTDAATSGLVAGQTGYGRWERPRMRTEGHPDKQGESTPAMQGETTPAMQGETTPAMQGETTPAMQGETTPAMEDDADSAPWGNPAITYPSQNKPEGR